MQGKLLEYQRAKTGECKTAAQIPAGGSVFSHKNSCQYEVAVVVSSYLCLPGSLKHFTDRAVPIVSILLGLNGGLDLTHLT